MVTTRNSDRTLAACLGSIREQTHPAIELIVVDNASADSTQEIAGRLADHVLTAGPERSAQRNRGAARARGAFLLFIDSDMRLEPGVVAECVSTVDWAPAVIVTEVSIGEGFWARCKALERSCYVGDDLIEAARFYRREAFEAAAGFDEQLTGPEDFDLSRRVAGGRRLPRTSSRILHDEGRLRLATTLAKKRRYGRSFGAYARRHRGVAMRQANVVLRGAYLRHWRRLARQPGLTAGMLAMRVLEGTAAAAGAAEGMLQARRSATGG